MVRYGDKTLEELYAELSRVERERDAKGQKHPDYQHANIMAECIRKDIARKQSESG